MAVTQEELRKYQQKAYEYLSRAGIVLTPEEQANIEIARTWGLGRVREDRPCLVTSSDTERVCAKSGAAARPDLPRAFHPREWQTRQRETSRCRWVRCTCMSPASRRPIRRPAPAGSVNYTVWHEMAQAGEQYTLYPETWTGSRAGRKARSSRSQNAQHDENDCSPTRASRARRRSDG